METEIRELLRERAEEVRVDPRIPPPVLRRARRRRVGTALLAGTVAAAVALGAVVGLRALLRPAPGPGQIAPRGAGQEAYRPIFPSTEEELRGIREQVSGGHLPLWTDPGGVGILYATNILGWQMDDVEADAGGDTPVRVVISNPALAREAGAPADIRTVLTLERFGDVYAVIQAESDIITLESPRPGDPVAPGTTVRVAGRLGFSPAGMTVDASLTWAEAGGAAGSGAPDGSATFEVDLELPGYVTEPPIVAVTVHGRSGAAVAINSFRLPLADGPPPTAGSAEGGVGALPAPVKDTRQAILEAAEARDWEALARLIPGPDFTYSIGDSIGSGEEAVAFWQDLEEGGERVLPTLIALLEASWGVTSGPEDIYVWPAANEKAPEDWTAEDLEQLRRIASRQEIEQWREAGRYGGEAVAIGAEGTWVFYIVGD